MDDPYVGKHPCRAKYVKELFDGPATLTCGKTDESKPMCFRGEPWCCRDHKKLVQAQTTAGKVRTKMKAAKKRRSGLQTD